MRQQFIDDSCLSTQCKGGAPMLARWMVEIGALSIQEMTHVYFR